MALLSLVDAWLTTAHVPGIGPLTGPAATGIPLLFVLVGDFRYFLFLEAVRTGRFALPGGAGWLRALAWTAIVPVVSKLVLAALPADMAGGRTLFLAYEACFALLTLVVTFAVLPRRTEGRRWAQRVTWFVCAYYALWASADVIILSGSDLGFLVRVVPNVLYYGGLIAFMCWSRPPSSGA